MVFISNCILSILTRLENSKWRTSRPTVQIHCCHFAYFLTKYHFCRRSSKSDLTICEKYRDCIEIEVLFSLLEPTLLLTCFSFCNIWKVSRLYQNRSLFSLVEPTLLLTCFSFCRKRLVKQVFLKQTKIQISQKLVCVTLRVSKSCQSTWNLIKSVHLGCFLRVASIPNVYTKLLNKYSLGT